MAETQDEECKYPSKRILKNLVQGSTTQGLLLLWQGVNIYFSYNLRITFKNSNNSFLDLPSYLKNYKLPQQYKFGESIAATRWRDRNLDQNSSRTSGQSKPKVCTNVVIIT